MSLNESAFIELRSHFAAGTGKRRGCSAYCCHTEDSRIVIIATNGEVMDVFANSGL